MSRIGRALFFLLAWVGATCDKLPGQGRDSAIYHVYIDTRVQLELGRLADSATVEHVRCLVGILYPDSVGRDSIIAIDQAVVPIAEAATLTTDAARCTIATLILWHNHIYAVAQKLGPRIGLTITEPRDACGLSIQDFRSATKPESPRLQVVQVNLQTFCWFVKQQLTGYRNRFGEPAIPIWLPAIEAQLRTDWGNDPREREP